jgi:peptidoglycan/LPS O-acetylase OafA/YrhL
MPELDGIRGLAILLVMLFHFGAFMPAEMASGSLACKLLGRVGGSGWCGVDLFFVLSGFLITGILYDTRGSRGYFRTFYARRAVRIFPLYYGLLLVAFVVVPRLAPRTFWPGVPAADRVWFWLYGVNFLRVFKGPASVGSLEHLWSLAVEEHFYLVWPLLVLRLGRRTLMGVCAVVPLASLALRSYLVLRGWIVAAYMLTPCRIDAMAIGAFLALAVRGPGGVAAVLPRARVAALAAGLPLLLMIGRRHGLLYHLGGEVQTVGYPLLAVFFGSMMVLAVASPASSSYGWAVRMPALRFVGKYSYGVYMYHFLLLGEFGRLFPPAALSRHLGSDLLGVLASLGLSMGCSVAIAWASWHAYERPFLSLKRLFRYR